MQQAVEQQADQPDGQTRRHGFPPGVSGHPRGGGLTYKERHDGEVGAMTTAFRAVHAREPTHYERVTISNAARLQLRLRRPANAEDLVKLTNTVRRLLKSLGLDNEPPRLSPRERILNRLEGRTA
jgi:hypothetical protein